MVSSTQILDFLPRATLRHGLAALAILALVLVSIAGCGQKGPLFIPVLRPAGTTVPKPPPAITVPVAPAPELQ